MKAVYVIKWTDSEINEGWCTDEKIDSMFIENPSQITSIGYLYKKSKKYVIIYADYDDSHKNRIIKIPRGCIKSIKKL